MLSGVINFTLNYGSLELYSQFMCTQEIIKHDSVHLFTEPIINGIIVSRNLIELMFLVLFFSIFSKTEWFKHLRSTGVSEDFSTLSPRSPRLRHWWDTCRSGPWALLNRGECSLRCSRNSSFALEDTESRLW